MEKLKLGYIGCGFMAQKVHIPNILSLEDDCELVALAEVRPKLGRKVQERYRIPSLYSHHQELAQDPNIQAVAVSGHYANQGEIAIDLLGAGKDVFMEKPMAISVAQAERILEAEQRSGKRLMVGYMKRFDAGNLLTKRLINDYRASDEMGSIRYVRNHGIVGEWVGGLDTPMETTDEQYPPASCPWPDWMPSQFYEGYIRYLQQYTHNVNLLRWILDAGGNINVKSVTLDPADGLSGVAVLEVAGVTAIIESGNVRGHEWNEHTQVFFEGGWVRTESPVLLLRNVPAHVEVYEGHKNDKALSQIFPEHGRSWPYKEEMRHFVDAVQNQLPFRSPASDAIEDVRILEAIYRKHIQSLG